MNEDLTTKCPEVKGEIVAPDDLTKQAASLNDAELLQHLQTTFRTIKDNLPYLREARERFGAPGRRLPVEGKPTWSEWVQMNLHVHIRTVQRWLAPPREQAEKKPRVKKQRNVRIVEPLRDWQEATRKANDLLLSIKRLKAHAPVGTDMLVEPMTELASLLGFQLVKK